MAAWGQAATERRGPYQSNLHPAHARLDSRPVASAGADAFDRPGAQLAGASKRRRCVAFFEAKFAAPDHSRALYAAAAEVGGDAIVTSLMQRSHQALCEMLATAADLAPISFVLSTSVVGPVQALLAAGAQAEVVDRVQAQLSDMVSAYLGGVGEVVASASPRR